MIVDTDNNTFDYKQFNEVRERAFGRLMWRLKRYSDMNIEPRLHAMGFSDFKLSYMGLLANLSEEGITNNELAKRACVTKQAMSKVVNLLEEEGYIYTRKNEHDSRSSIIFLNDRGKDLIVAVHTCSLDVKQRLIKVIGEARWTQMIDTMCDLVMALDSEENKGCSPIL